MSHGLDFAVSVRQDRVICDDRYRMRVGYPPPYIGTNGGRASNLAVQTRPFRFNRSYSRDDHFGDVLYTRRRGLLLGGKRNLSVFWMRGVPR